MAKTTSVVAGYSELYEEGEVDYIKRFLVSFPTQITTLKVDRSN